MSNLIELNLRPDDDTLRQFGWIALVGFGVLAACAWFEILLFGFGLGAARVGITLFFASLAGLAAFFSLVYPRANWPIYVGLSLVAFPIGWVVANLILGTLFYVLITPVGLVFKVLGRDSLNRSFNTEAATYWKESKRNRGSESYFKQF